MARVSLSIKLKKHGKIGLWAWYLAFRFLPKPASDWFFKQCFEFNIVKGSK